MHTDLVGLVLAASEVLLLLRKRSERGAAGSADRGSLRLLWGVILAAIGAASLVASKVGAGRLADSAGLDAAIWALLLGGLALRWWAILVLGRFFTVDVAILEGHQVVSRGPYGRLRHPSYAGLLLAFLGLGLAFHSWPALAVLLVPISAALVWRMHIEEQALAAALGAAWRDYAARTARLVPGLW